MEQTMGKRIMANRKRLGLTQDQLAEKLGVTAQAVSKWENDLSCPDIAMLPALADIFGVSVDELLGRETGKVHEAEVVSREETENTGHHTAKANLEFNFDGGKKGMFGLAVWVLLTGGLLLAGRFYEWDASLWEILWPSALLTFGLFGLYPKFSFFQLACALCGGYFLLENIGVLPFGLDRGYLLPVFLVLFGLSLLFQAMRKKKKPQFQFTYSGDGRHPNRKASGDYQSGEDFFDLSASFGSRDQNVSVPRLAHGEINVNFGEYRVDFSEVEEVAENCTVEANCSFGELTLFIPKRYQVKSSNNGAFASIETHGHPYSDTEGTIYLTANASFGQITVQYI